MSSMEKYLMGNKQNCGAPSYLCKAAWLRLNVSGLSRRLRYTPHYLKASLILLTNQTGDKCSLMSQSQPDDGAAY